MLGDDDLVYPAREPTQQSMTQSSLDDTVHDISAVATHALPLFRCQLLGLPADVLIDTGASSTFVSASWCQDNGVSYRPVHNCSAALASGSQSCPGVVPHATLNLLGEHATGTVAYKSVHDFIVTDLEGFDVVVGLDWLNMHCAHLNARTSTLHVAKHHKEVLICASPSLVA